MYWFGLSVGVGPDTIVLTTLTMGGGGFTVRQRGCTPLISPLPGTGGEIAVMLVAVFVKSGALLGQPGNGFNIPAWLVILTEMVHVPPAATSTPVTLMLASPNARATFALLVTVGVPPQPGPMTTPGGLPTLSCRGRKSVKNNPVFKTALGSVFVMVKVSTDVPPSKIVSGLNDLVRIGIGGAKS